MLNRLSENYQKEIALSLIFIFLITMTITLIFSVLTSLLISQKFTRHIHILLNAFKQASDGDLNVTVDATTPNEFGQLNRHFNQMIQKLNNLIQRVYQSQLLQKQSELKALQAQITPHFLYNTLNSISWRAQLQGCNDVSAMCVALATLLRKSIGDKSPFISIAAEMEYLNSYLTIQKYRYGDRIKVLLDISPELQNFYIPKLILQPIVENSFVHAFNDSSDGYIFIKGVIQNHDIILTVKDNGSGIPAEKIRLVFNRVDADVADEFSHVVNYVKKEKNATANTDAAIFESELFDALGVKKLTVEALLKDETDYKALLKSNPEASAKEKNAWGDMHGLKALARSVNRNLDSVFSTLFK